MTGSSVMTTPAACVPALRTTPSMLAAVSINFLQIFGLVVDLLELGHLLERFLDA